MVCACSPGYSGGWDRRIAWTQEVEIAVSQDGSPALQPGQQIKTLSKKKGKELSISKEYIHPLFIAELSIIVKIRNLLNVSINRWMDEENVVYIFKMAYYSAIK